MNNNAIKLLRERYTHPGETPEGVFKRVAKALAIRDDRFEKKIYEAMVNGVFLPNSPCIRNAGRKRGSLSACFVLPIEDSVASIYQTLTNMAVIFQRGGGVGINFSRLRPEGFPLSSGGTSSGPISFMKVFDVNTEVIKQGGFRRGASMLALNCDHVDIEKFCQTKLKGDLCNANLSVVATNKFMELAIANKTMDLIHNGQVYRTVNAKNILDLMAFSAWVCGDPGVLFYDTINACNPRYPEIKIDCTNPCQPADALLLDDDRLIPISHGGLTWNSWISGVKEVIELTCNNGLRIRFTPEHKLQLADGTWEEAGKTLGKALMWPECKRHVSGCISEYYVLLGFLFGDGFICGSGHGIGVRLNCKKEWEITDLLLKYGFRKQPSGALYINRNELQDVDFLKQRTYERVIPDHIMTDNSDNVISFLRGLFEANGSVNRYGQISLKATCRKMVEQVQVQLASFGIPSWIVCNNPTWINWENGTYLSRESYNLQIAPRNAWRFKEIIGFVSQYKNDRIKKFMKQYNNRLIVTSITSLGPMEVWDYNMHNSPNHNFCQGVIAKNCGEVPAPPYGACVLGSINLAKFVHGDTFAWDELENIIEIGTRALLNVNVINVYPLTNIQKMMQDLNSIGLGFMGFADALIMLGIYYDSKECLSFIDDVGKRYVSITNEIASDSFAKRSIAPTGSLSILADCSSGIEPVFARSYERHITLGVIEEHRNIYESQYCRTAHEISPEWHLKVQAQWTKYTDQGVSKTINCPADTTVKDIRNIFVQAWKAGIKGVTVFRDSSKDGVYKAKCDDATCML